MAKEVKCRVIDEMASSVHIVLPVVNHPNKQRRVFVPYSQCEKIMRAGPTLRRDTIYCDTVTVSDWLATKEDL